VPFLIVITLESKALKEKLEYGKSDQGLPVIVIYPDYSEKTDITDGWYKTKHKGSWN